MPGTTFGDALLHRFPRHVHVMDRHHASDHCSLPDLVACELMPPVDDLHGSLEVGVINIHMAVSSMRFGDCIEHACSSLKSLSTHNSSL